MSDKVRQPVYLPEGMSLEKRRRDRRRSWIFCGVVGVLCALLCFLPTGFPEITPQNSTRERARVLSVDNSQLAPLGIVYSGTQTAELLILSGRYQGQTITGANHLNSALDKDKLFAPGEEALVILHAGEDGPTNATLVDHYRLTHEGWLFGLFGLLLVVFGGVAGCGALVSLVASVLMVWKILIPLLLKGYPPLPVALFMVVALTALIDLLVAGFTQKAVAAMLGSLLGTLVTGALAVAFGTLLRLDGGNLPYVVPLLSQNAMQLNIRDIFFSMVFVANSGSLMDLSMDIAAACEEVLMHHPGIGRGALMKSGFAVGRSVIGTMTTTLMLAYSGSYLSMMMYFAGQGTPVMDILNLKYVAAEILTTLVGSFGLVTVAPFTAIVAGALFTRRRSASAASDAVQ